MIMKEYISMLSNDFENSYGLYFIYLWLVPALLSNFLTDPLIENFQHSLYLLIIGAILETILVGKGKKGWRRFSLLLSGGTFFYLTGSSLQLFFDKGFAEIWSFSQFNPHFLVGNMGFILILVAVFMCDTMAYFTGSLIGKHKFSTISPNKTIEGSLGGLITSVVVMTLAFHFFSADHVPTYLGVIMGLAIGFFAQLGDLLESLIKRYFNVKDSSNILPGHGGLFDRFDSLLFVAPIIHLIITLFNKLS